MSAAQLRLAAMELRVHVQEVTGHMAEDHPGMGWEDACRDGWLGGPVGEFCALMSPPVALAWADLLEFIAETPRRDLDDEVYRRAIQAARAILREPAEGERP